MDRPNKLQFEATNANVSILQNVSRVFVTHKAPANEWAFLLEIHLENDAKPCACHTPVLTCQFIGRNRLK